MLLGFHEGTGMIKIKEDEMGWSSSAHMRDEKCIQNFGCKIEGKMLLGR
jgi:hypothetical protein